MITGAELDPDACYRASIGRESRWDGRSYLGVVTTGVYCRPSCPARKPLPRICRVYPSAAAAVAAGFRACRRCCPETLPGSGRWDVRGDLAAWAVRMIRDGVVDEVDEVDEVLSADPLLAPLVSARPGLRVPGAIDGFETAAVAVLGHQVSVLAAATVTARLVADYGTPAPSGLSLFPTAQTLAEAGAQRLRETTRVPGARAEALNALAEATAAGLALGADADRDASRAALLALPGVGAWTSEYIALRALGDPDAFPGTDLILRRALGVRAGATAEQRARDWRPWRAHAAQHLWTPEAQARPTPPLLRPGPPSWGCWSCPPRPATSPCCSAPTSAADHGGVGAHVRSPPDTWAPPRWTGLMTSPKITAVTTATVQDDKARAFHALHTGGLLVLPNAWDVASAVMVRDAGAPAVATTSAGASWSLGAPDGEKLDRDRAVDLIARIVALVDEPVTADLEAGVALFLNARTDVYLAQATRPQDRLAETIRRAETYLAAGADGIFVPGLADPGTIVALVEAIPAPVNLRVGPGAPTITQLADLGVRRVSVGMAVAQAVYAHTRRAAEELLTAGTCTNLDDGLDHSALNTALAAPRPG